MGLILLLVVVYAVICVAVYCGNRPTLSSHFGKLVRPIISVPVCARMRAMGGARLCLPKINT